MTKEEAQEKAREIVLDVEARSGGEFQASVFYENILIDKIAQALQAAGTRAEVSGITIPTENEMKAWAKDYRDTNEEWPSAYQTYHWMVSKFVISSTTEPTTPATGSVSDDDIWNSMANFYPDHTERAAACVGAKWMRSLLSELPAQKDSVGAVRSTIKVYESNNFIGTTAQRDGAVACIEIIKALIDTPKLAQKERE